jgi:hypothetical protein
LRPAGSARPGVDCAVEEFTGNWWRHAARALTETLPSQDRDSTVCDTGHYHDDDEEDRYPLVCVHRA